VVPWSLDPSGMSKAPPDVNAGMMKWRSYLSSKQDFRVRISISAQVPVYELQRTLLQTQVRIRVSSESDGCMAIDKRVGLNNRKVVRCIMHM
jgi:hypothetical protein